MDCRGVGSMKHKLVNFIRNNFSIGDSEPTDRQLYRLYSKIIELRNMGMLPEYIEGFIFAHFHEITGCTHGQPNLSKAEDLTTFSQAVTRLESLVKNGVIQ
jgi:hypothetical protein